MSLQEYHKKRDFAKTPEPSGSTEQEKKNREHKTSTSNLRLVVQRHEATRLHYDFRLEILGHTKRHLNKSESKEASSYD